MKSVAVISKRFAPKKYAVQVDVRGDLRDANHRVTRNVRSRSVTNLHKQLQEVDRESKALPTAMFVSSTPSLQQPDGKKLQTSLSDSGTDRLVDYSAASPGILKPAFRRQGAITTSAWLLIRNGAASSSLAPGGQLGASQAGTRVQVHAFDVNGRFELGLNGRASGALGSPHQLEGALGVYVKAKGSVPGQVIFERRQNLGGGGRNSFALIVATGIDETFIAKGFKLFGYGQAGLVGLSRRDLFVDGSLRLERELKLSKLPSFRIGAGVWGAAQTGAARLDIGPRISTNVDAAGFRLNIGAEWRQRVAGSASPGSGPVIVIATDFSR